MFSFHKTIIKSVVFLLCASCSFNSMALEVTKSLENVSSGQLISYKDFPSSFVNNRRVQVWLPDNYNEEDKYAVLYMHDGQMLFDANVTWNKQEWMVDEVAGQLSKQKNIKPFIVVGIDNGGSDLRHSEYFPQKPFLSLTAEQRKQIMQAERSSGHTTFKSEIVSDKYLKFVVTELKPFIDQHYSVHSDRDNTFVLGSSMGGLISMYALLEYPDTFGGAACMSTHWPGIFSSKNNPVPNAFYRYLQLNLSLITTQKLYFDHGDQTLDAMYPPLQQEVDKIMAGFNVDKTLWQSHFFAGTNHSEEAWQKRLHIPMTFLLTTD